MAKKRKLKQVEAVEVGAVGTGREVAWWVQGLIVFGVTYCIGLGLRLWELPFWLAGDFRVDGQWLMATNDAYYWLAGAEGITSTAGSGRTAVPDFVAWLAGLTGWSHANIAFWLPAVMAPLTALPVCLVAARWRMPEAGVWAGLMTVLAPGYWQRTRLGFLDDELLKMPVWLLLAGGLVLLLASYCRKGFFNAGMPGCWDAGIKTRPDGGKDGESVSRLVGGKVKENAGVLGRGKPSGSPNDQPLPHQLTDSQTHRLTDPPVTLSDIFFLLAGGLVLGLWAMLGVWIYPKGFSLVFAFAVAGLGAGLVLGRRGFRAGIFGAFVVLFCAWFAPLAVALAAALLVLAVFLLWRVAMGRGWIPAVPVPLVWVPVALAILAGGAYFTQGLWLPRLEWTWSQIQAYYQAVATEDTRRAVFHGNVSEVIRLPAWAVSYLLAGHWILVVLGALGFGLLLWKRPLAVVFLPLAGIAGAAYFLGARFTVFSAAFFGLGLGCGFVLLLRHFQVRTRWRWAAMVLLLPVVFWFVHKPVTHFRPDTVMSLRQVEVLRELGPVASTNAVIWNTWDLGFATNYYTRRRAIEMIGSNRGIYTNALAQDDKSVAKAQILRRGQDLDHYVVVSWEKLGGMENLLATGTFDQRTGTSAKQGQIQRLTGTFEFDLNQGFLIAPGGRIPLCILDVIEEDGPQRFVWPWHGQGNHAVLNRIERTGYLMDATVADTMYVRMLLGPAEEMGPEFEVVVDDFPWVRVYRVE